MNGEELLAAIYVAIGVMDDRLAQLQEQTNRFTELLDKYLPLLEKYEQGGAVGMLFGGKRRETTWAPK